MEVVALTDATGDEPRDELDEHLEAILEPLQREYASLDAERTKLRRQVDAIEAKMKRVMRVLGAAQPPKKTATRDKVPGVWTKMKAPDPGRSRRYQEALAYIEAHRDELNEKGFSQSDFARAIGLSPGTLSPIFQTLHREGHIRRDPTVKGPSGAVIYKVI